ncbi:MAG: hypothetical protein BWY80_00882 [Firmicutes bacterium ADurb.Bin456]|nr:MAG: hypothetical protein BWY80_00882 [Firmicutes bacterium ADurb.Bin456]
MGPFFVPFVGSQRNQTGKTQTSYLGFTVNVTGTIPQSFLTVRMERGPLMQSDLFSFSPGGSPYWVPYDTIVRNVPDGGIPEADLIRAVNLELRQTLPGTCKDPEPRKGKQVKKPIIKTFFPIEEYARLINCDVLTVKAGAVYRLPGVAPLA